MTLDDFSSVFDALPTAASLWAWSPDERKASLLLGNEAFRIMFRRRSKHAHTNTALDQVVTPACAAELHGFIAQAVQQHADSRHALHHVGVHATQVRIVPLEGNRVALFWKGELDETPPSTPAALRTPSSAEDAAGEATPSFPPSSSSSSSSSSATETPIGRSTSAIRKASSSVSSPLKSVKLERKLESPSTGIKAAKKCFDIIEGGASLSDPKRDLGEVLPNLVAEQNSEGVIHALAHGADPDGAREAPFSPLYAAIKLGRVALCEVRSSHRSRALRTLTQRKHGPPDSLLPRCLLSLNPYCHVDVQTLLSEGASLSQMNRGNPAETPVHLATKLDPESPIYELMLEHIRFGEYLCSQERATPSASQPDRQDGIKRARTHDDDHEHDSNGAE